LWVILLLPESNFLQDLIGIPASHFESLAEDELLKKSQEMENVLASMVTLMVVKVTFSAPTEPVTLMVLSHSPPRSTDVFELCEQLQLGVT